MGHQATARTLTYLHVQGIDHLFIHTKIFLSFLTSWFTTMLLVRFIEIMAPVFSRDSWRCVWHMLQNDLVHGWGLDFALRKCVEVKILM